MAVVAVKLDEERNLCDGIGLNLVMSNSGFFSPNKHKSFISTTAAFLGLMVKGRIYKEYNKGNSVGQIISTRFRGPNTLSMPFLVLFYYLLFYSLGRLELFHISSYLEQDGPIIQQAVWCAFF